MPANTYAANRSGHRPLILMHPLRVGRAGPTQDGRPCPSRLPRVALPETAQQQRKRRQRFVLVAPTPPHQLRSRLPLSTGGGAMSTGVAVLPG